ncbi:MAG: FHA domain-containing protein [Planctomycetes bacterium]|nr:FHA domain-containing protein [Planctomycetota bacterium]MCH7603293.1 FHA domain-containing protein [Planctomycetota bacterium]
MGVWLVMKTADGLDRPFQIDKPRTVIGRETRCDVRIPVSAVSKRHCEIRLHDGELSLTDLGSDSGTFHNGDRVEKAKLSHDDTLTVGPVTFVVRVSSDHHADKPVVEIHRQHIRHAEETT